MADNKGDKKMADLNLDGMSDADLLIKAKGLGIIPTEDMKREDIEKAVKKAVVEKGKEHEKRNDEMKKDRKVRIQYISKGTTEVNKKKWRGTMKGIVTEEEARLLLGKFPKRFKIIK
jgi:hypothetical protein